MIGFKNLSKYFLKLVSIRLPIKTQSSIVMNFIFFPKLDDCSKTNKNIDIIYLFLHFGRIFTKETLIKIGGNAYFVDKINEDIMQII
jgi:hypothetical protein